MTPEQINIAVATACGQLYHKPTDEEIVRGSYYHYEPDYCGDLTLMHSAEKRLPHDPDFTYEKMLHEITNGRGERATARQRAEAFLKTIGKWTE